MGLLDKFKKKKTENKKSESDLAFERFDRQVKEKIEKQRQLEEQLKKEREEQLRKSSEYRKHVYEEAQKIQNESYKKTNSFISSNFNDAISMNFNNSKTGYLYQICYSYLLKNMNNVPNRKNTSYDALYNGLSGIEEITGKKYAYILPFLIEKKFKYYKRK